MSREDRRLQRHVDALVRNRRPPRQDLGEDAAAAQVAARLHAAHPGAAEPSAEFVDALARRLRRTGGESDAPRMPDRRRLLGAAGLAAAAGVGAGFGIDRLIAAAPAPASGGAQERLQPVAGAWVAVTTLAAVERRGAVRFSAGGVEGYVLQQAGQLSALSAACTDQGCILNADAARGRLVCPCHGATFRMDGMPDAQPTYSGRVTPLPRIDVRVNGTQVEVLVPNLA